MSWDLIFADSHFTGATWALPIGDEVTHNPDQITLSPLQFVTDVEPIGYSYHKLVFPEVSTYSVPVLQEDEIDVEELLDAVREADLDDYYALLYVKDKGNKATVDDVKKTWKVINLYLHPDKADSSRKAEAEIRFKACQRAYETFLDPALRLDYDSSVDFDDSVPSATAGTKSLEDFLKVYSPVFERNARWSRSQPVPMLGDENSNEDQLAKFYKFWLGFSSWREFPDADTEKVGDSASRDERRRAQQKNERQRAAAKAKEVARIRGFVTNAEKIDPRMKLFKQQKAERERAAKQAAYDAKQNKGKSTTQTAVQSKQQPTQVVTVPLPTQTVEQKEQDFITMVRNKLHGALTNDKHFVVNIDKRPQIPLIVDKVIGDYDACKKLDDLLMVNGYTDLKGINGRRVLEIDPITKAWDELEGRVREVCEVSKNVWTEQEESKLNEFLIKFPVGTKGRYEKIAVQINLVNGGKVKRTEKDVIKKVKELEIIRQVGMEQYKQLKAQAHAQGQAVVAPAPGPPTRTTADEKNSTTKTEKAPAPAAPAVTTPAPIVWTADEQKLLEKGLQTVPKDAADRWEQIGKVVATKTGPQCEARFTWLREQIAAKKAAAAAAAAQK